MSNQRQAIQLLKAGLSPILVNIQTGLSAEQILLPADVKAKVRSLVASNIPSLNDILSVPNKASDAAALLLLYTALADRAELQVDIDKLVAAYEDYLREYRLVQRTGLPSPLSLDEAWVLARELRSSDQITLLNKIISSVVKGH
ncbi:hypothetical protein M5G27_29750 [Pseudomonas shahriarae]|uniref:Uncharacterized protein n=1 Tax=Pseudomonas shahriarae TaxID=2745512 RepID=A0A9X4HG93_9PSED|nr:MULTISPECIES: hypothetical protein [Pseudomonas]MDD1011644.1 hypothetical protein [Pseudomonas shahriarae]